MSACSVAIARAGTSRLLDEDGTAARRGRLDPSSVELLDEDGCSTRTMRREGGADVSSMCVGKNQKNELFFSPAFAP